jgi:hypothetical protein
MKTLKFMSLLIGGLILGVASVSAQTAGTSEAEHHAKLTESHNHAKEHAKAIASGQSKTKEEHKKHAAEAGKNLDEAKKQHSALKEGHHGKHAERHAAIDKSHAEADQHLKALNGELSKPNPDDKKVKEHAQMHHDAMDNAEKEHEKMKKEG